MDKTENQKKLLKVLNEIFQLDRSDLDYNGLKNQDNTML